VTVVGTIDPFEDAPGLSVTVVGIVDPFEDDVR
jgi:hypothetical protein